MDCLFYKADGRPFLTYIRLSRSLEETVIRTIAQDGVKGGRSTINTGVWIDGNKVSAQGITAPMDYAAWSVCEFDDRFELL